MKKTNEKVIQKYCLANLKYRDIEFSIQRTRHGGERMIQDRLIDQKNAVKVISMNIDKILKKVGNKDSLQFAVKGNFKDIYDFLPDTYTGKTKNYKVGDKKLMVDEFSILQESSIKSMYKRSNDKNLFVVCSIERIAENKYTINLVTAIVKTWFKPNYGTTFIA